MAEGLEIKEGLQGVYITKSEICKVDGQEGKLYYRGYKIEDLANYSSYEEVCYLLLYGKLPNSKELADFIKNMKEERSISENTKEIIRRFSKESQTLDVLRTAMSSLSADDSKPYSDNENENIEKAIITCHCLAYQKTPLLASLLLHKVHYRVLHLLRGRQCSLLAAGEKNYEY